MKFTVGSIEDYKHTEKKIVKLNLGMDKSPEFSDKRRSFDIIVCRLSFVVVMRTAHPLL